MANGINLDLFWELLAEIQGESTELTAALKAIVNNEQATSQKLFDVVIDQMAYNSPDWHRTKNFLRDWYAAHRAVTTYQANISDIYQLPNNQLDELFRSFGYNFSNIIQDPTTNEAPSGKPEFFLDLVNLYKRKGTPQALLEVLQYHGVNRVDLYELDLQYEDRLSKNPNDLIFKGKYVTGTSGSHTPVYLPFRFLTERDPHWLQTESEIKHLYNQNIINFPSTSPYFSVKPLFDEESTDGATGILSRRIQDSYDLWDAAGRPDEVITPILPQNAVVSITGDDVSILTLYLATIYTFLKDFTVGASADRFICYDGTNINSIDIMNEFRILTDRKVSSRDEFNTRWNQYLDIFSRELTTNFIQNHIDPAQYLNLINPALKNQLDNLATDNVTVLGTLLRDLGEWVRNNISYGFINMGYILFGLDSFFAEMSDIINVFKPYRARLVPLETIQFDSRLFNTIVVEDEFTTEIEQNTHDFVTGDSKYCCTEQGIDSTARVCIDSTGTQRFYSRETYDCGSWHDIGAVTDMPEEVFVQYDDKIYDSLRCPSSYGDGTAAIHIASNLGKPNAPIVTSELIDYEPLAFDIVNITEGSDIVEGKFRTIQTDLGYALTLNLFNIGDSTPSLYSHIITEKSLTKFKAKLSDITDSTNYSMSYDYDNTDNSGIINVPNGTNIITVPIPPPPEIIDETSYTVAVSLSNIIDPNPSTYYYSVIGRTINDFTVQFSGNMDSSNYYLEWILICHDKQDIQPLSLGWTSVVIPLDPYEINENYGVSLALLNTVDSTSSIIPFIVTDKSINGFTVLFDSPIDSPNYSLMWSRPLGSSTYALEYNYYQTGGFVNFDGVPAWDGTSYVYVEGTEGRFDCTHGFDYIQIHIDDFHEFILQENGDYLTQEDGSRLLL